MDRGLVIPAWRAGCLQRGRRRTPWVLAARTLL